MTCTMLVSYHLLAHVILIFNFLFSIKVLIKYKFFNSNFVNQVLRT